MINGTSEQSFDRLRINKSQTTHSLPLTVHPLLILNNFLFLRWLRMKKPLLKRTDSLIATRRLLLNHDWQRLWFFIKNLSPCALHLVPFIRLRQNTLQLVAGMNGETNHGEARQSEDGLSAIPAKSLIADWLRRNSA
jgi:hypothetical protein